MKPHQKKRRTEETTPQVKINTTFSGKIAKFIQQQQQHLDCSAPEVIRRVLTKHVTHHPIFLDKKIVDAIEKMVTNPLIREKHGLVTVEMFITWAIQKCLELLSSEIGNLKQPAVQSLLTAHEKEVAKHLLLLSRDLKHYGGVTIDQIAKASGLEKDIVMMILKQFVRNGWVQEIKDEDLSYFLPKE